MGKPKKDLLFVADKDPFLLSSREKPSISKPEKSSALDRVKGFLPLLQKSNEVNEESPHIELSLALGVNDNDSDDEEGDVNMPNIVLPAEIQTENEIEKSTTKLIEEVTEEKIEEKSV